MKIDVECGTCTLCCKFKFSQGKWYSKDKTASLVPFDPYWFDLYFQSRKNRYFIDSSCSMFSDDKCSIYNRITYPALCNLYPVMLIKNRQSDMIEIGVDTNCPRWKQIKTLLSVNNKRSLLGDYCNSLLDDKQPVLYNKVRLQNSGYRLEQLFLIKRR